MNEAETQNLAAWQARQIVDHLRRMGWVFAAVVVWTRKDEGGLAGASYFDLPKADAGAMPLLADAVRMVAAELDRSFKAIGARESMGDRWLHTLGGTGVDEQAKRARERNVLDAMGNVPEAVLERVARDVDNLALAFACQAEQHRRRAQ